MTRRNNTASDPTELEAATLGAIWKLGPSTAYAIRQTFLQSRSPRFSGSAGAIYPLIRRLEDEGLVKSESKPRGKRAQNDYRITRKGKNVLRKWIKRTSVESASKLVHDPLRTKVFFLDLLSDVEAYEMLNEALTEMQSAAKVLKQDCLDNPLASNRTSHFAARNALLITLARIEWLKEVLKSLPAPNSI